MRNISPVVGLLWVLSASHVAIADATAAPPGSRFGEHGFSFEPPAGSDPNHQLVIYYLPEQPEFTPNVNVQLQPYNGSLADYVALSNSQFKEAGWRVLTEKQDQRSATFEYAGMFQGKPLHWYARALLDRGRVILATATAAESQWSSVAKALRRSIDSLRLP